MTRRTADRHHRRLDMEALEVRTLLSVGQGAGGAQVNSVVRPPQVLSARPADGGSGTAAGATTDFDAIIGASAARSKYQVNGKGETVAVIDTGVNYNHEALGGGLGAGHKVVGGYDFADDNADPFAKTLDHGTAVAGLIASSDPTHPGVAPGADVVALRVFDDNNNGDFNRVADALQWVIDHHSEYNITAVNLSLSDGNNYTTNWFANDGAVGQRITSLVGRLDGLNIPVISATGNSFTGAQGQGFTSIIADTISVTSTDASDQIVANAQRLGASAGGASATDLAAPGVDLLAPLGGDSFAGVTGTSFSAPLVTGAVVLMQQLYQQRFGTLPSVALIDSWLKAGADPVHDPVTGITIGRLDIPRALSQVPNPASQVLTPPSQPSDPPPPPVTNDPPADPPAKNDPPADPPQGGSTGTTNPPPTSGWTGGTVWVNGRSIDATDIANAASGNLTGLPAWFQKVASSFKNWITGSAGSGASGQVWTARTLGNSTPAGVVRAKAAARRAAVQAQAQAHARARSQHQAAAHQRAQTHVRHVAAGPMTRPWHTFTARRPGR